LIGVGVVHQMVLQHGFSHRIGGEGHENVQVRQEKLVILRETVTKSALARTGACLEHGEDVQYLDILVGIADQLLLFQLLRVALEFGQRQNEEKADDERDRSHEPKGKAESSQTVQK